MRSLQRSARVCCTSVVLLFFLHSSPILLVLHTWNVANLLNFYLERALWHAFNFIGFTRDHKLSPPSLKCTLEAVSRLSVLRNVISLGQVSNPVIWNGKQAPLYIDVILTFVFVAGWFSFVEECEEFSWIVSTHVRCRVDCRCRILNGWRCQTYWMFVRPCCRNIVIATQTTSSCCFFFYYFIICSFVAEFYPPSSIFIIFLYSDEKNVR